MKTVSLDFDKAGGPERAEVSRDGRLWQFEDFDDVTHAELSSGEEAQDAEARRIGEGLEEGVEVRNRWWGD